MQIPITSSPKSAAFSSTTLASGEVNSNEFDIVGVKARFIGGRLPSSPRELRLEVNIKNFQAAAYAGPARNTEILTIQGIGFEVDGGDPTIYFKTNKKFLTESSNADFAYSDRSQFSIDKFELPPRSGNWGQSVAEVSKVIHSLGTAFGGRDGFKLMLKVYADDCLRLKPPFVIKTDVLSKVEAWLVAMYDLGKIEAKWEADLGLNGQPPLRGISAAEEVAKQAILWERNPTKEQQLKDLGKKYGITAKRNFYRTFSDLPNSEESRSGDHGPVIDVTRYDKARSWEQFVNDKAEIPLVEALLRNSKVQGLPPAFVASIMFGEGAGWFETDMSNRPFDPVRGFEDLGLDNATAFIQDAIGRGYLPKDFSYSETPAVNDSGGKVLSATFDSQAIAVQAFAACLRIHVQDVREILKRKFLGQPIPDRVLQFYAYIEYNGGRAALLKEIQTTGLTVPKWTGEPKPKFLPKGDNQNYFRYNAILRVMQTEVLEKVFIPEPARKSGVT
jgi:hypothetical protein